MKQTSKTHPASPFEEGGLRGICWRGPTLLVILFLIPAVSFGAPLGSSFTYQGQLTQQGIPANGAFDFQFKLFDASGGGAQIGGDVARNAVVVDDGVFTVDIDFGASAFDGQARYLEIRVRPAGLGIFTQLMPRQPITATPYALYSSSAAAVPWTGVSGVPGGLADGMDNDTQYTAGTGLTLSGQQFSVNTSVIQTRVSASCAAGSSIRSIDAAGGVVCEVDDAGISGVTAGAGLTGGGSSGNVGLGVDFAGSGSAGSVARSDHNHDDRYATKLARTIVVSPVGTPSQNGTALLNALNALTDASCANPYLLRLEPGVYDVGSSPVVMKTCVGIEGGGELLTEVRGAGAASVNSGTIVGASNTELRRLTVKNTGGNVAAVAIFTNNASLKLTHVTALASGGSSQNYGIYYKSTDVADISNVTAEASGGTTARGVYNQASSPFMTDVRATAVGASGTFGVYNDAATPVMTNVDAVASGGTTCYGIYNTGIALPVISGGSVFAACNGTNYGINNNDGASALISHATISVLGGTTGYGVFHDNAASAGMNGLRISVFAGTTSYGIFNQATSGTRVVDIGNSIITATTATVRNDDEFVTRIGASQLAGGAVQGGGLLKCAGVYDEQFDFFAGPACP